MPHPNDYARFKRCADGQYQVVNSRTGEVFARNLSLEAAAVEVRTLNTGRKKHVK